jgi:TP901 family phage tail tape measure protein
MANNFDEVIRLIIQASGEQDISKISSAVTEAKRSFDTLSEPAQQALSEIEKLTQQAGRVEGFAALKAQVTDTSNRLNAAKAGLAALNTEFDRTDTSNAKINRSFAQAEAQVASLTKQHNALSAQLTTSGAALERSGVDTQNLSASHAKLSQQVAAASQHFAELATNANRSGLDRVKGLADTAGSALKGGAEKAVEFGKRLLEISGIAGLVAGGLAAITGIRFFEEGAADAATFDTALAKLRATTGATGEELERLKDTALEAGKATNTGAAASVDALAQLTSSLGSADAAAQELPASLELARAAQISVAGAVDIVSESIKAFNVPAQQSGEIVDQLAAVALKTGANLGSLTSSFGQIAPIAKQLGLSFNDVVDVLGLLQSKGIDAEKATRSLRTVFTDLQNPSSELSKELAGLGISTATFSGVVDGLSKAGQRGTDALQTLGAKGAGAMLALVQAGSGSLKAFQDSLGNVEGQARRTGQTLEDAITPALKNLQRDFSQLAGESVEGGIRPITDELQKLDGQLKTVSETPAFQRIKQAIGDFVAAGVRYIDQFIQKFDFDSASQSIAQFVADGAAKFKSLGEGVTAFGKIISGIGAVVGVALNSTKAFFYGVAAVTDLFIASLLKAFQTLRAVSGASIQELAAYQGAIDTYVDGAKQFNEAAVQSAGDLAENLKKLSGAILGTGAASTEAKAKQDELTKTNEAHAAKVADLRKQYDALPASVRASIPPFDKLVDAIDKPAGSLKKFRQLTDDQIAALAVSTAKTTTTFDQQQQAILDASISVDAARTKLDQLAQSGDGNRDAFNRANREYEAAKQKLAELRGSADGAKPSLNDLKASFESLGITSQAQLKLAADAAEKNFQRINNFSDNTAAGLTDKRNAFIAYASAALAASAGLDEGAKASVRAQLEDRASALGLTDALKILEGQASQTGNALLDQAQKAEDAARRQRIAAEQAGAANFNAGVQIQIAGDKADAATKKAEQGFTEWGDAADQAALSAKGITADTSHANQAMNDLSNTAAATYGNFKNISQAAAELDEKITLELGQHLEEAFGPAGETSGFNAAYAAIADGAKKVNDIIDEQRAELRAQVGEIDSLGYAASKNFGGFGDDAESALTKMRELSDSISSGQYDARLLGQQELQPLQQALDAARSRVQALADATKAAKQQFDQLTQSAQDALDEAAGNDTAIEDRRHQKQLDDLKTAAKAANELNSAEYQQAVDNENKLHDLKSKNIKDEANQREASRTTSNSGSGGGSSGGGSSSTPVSKMTLDIKLDGTALRALSVDPANANQVAAQLMPHIIGQLQQAMRNAGGRV